MRLFLIVFAAVVCAAAVVIVAHTEWTKTKTKWARDADRVTRIITAFASEPTKAGEAKQLEGLRVMLTEVAHRRPYGADPGALALAEKELAGRERRSAVMKSPEGVRWVAAVQKEMAAFTAAMNNPANWDAEKLDRIQEAMRNLKRFTAEMPPGADPQCLEDLMNLIRKHVTK